MDVTPVLSVVSSPHQTQRLFLSPTMPSRHAPVASSVSRSVQTTSSVSAASVFMRQARGIPKPVRAPKRVRINSPERGETLVSKDVIDRHRTGKRSSSFSPDRRKPARKASQAPLHPIAQSFNHTTHDYRTILYSETTSKINETHDKLITRLHDAMLDDAQAFDALGNAQVRLPAWARLQHASNTLSVPLGATKLLLTHTDEDGKKVRFESTLHTRIQDFVDHCTEEEKELRRLEMEWEDVLGQIWNVGVHILGQGSMNELLLPKSAEVRFEAEQEEEEVIVRDGDTKGMASKRRKDKKKVSFIDPIPKFLSRPAKHCSVASTPHLDVAEVESLEKRITEIGARAIQDVQNFQKDQRSWWCAKEKKITAMLAEG